jgi:membrane protein
MSTHERGSDPGPEVHRREVAPPRGAPEDARTEPDSDEPTEPVGDEPDRGRDAERPWEIPPRGWKDVLMRVKDQVERDNVSIVAAGVAFWALFGIFPLIIALVSLYGLIADPIEVQRQANNVLGVLPGDARSLIEGQLISIVESPQGSLSLGLIVSVVGFLFTASVATQGLLEGVNIAYNEPEKRNFIKRRGIAMIMALALVVAGILSLFIIAVVPILLGALGLGDVSGFLISLLRWPLLAVGVTVGLRILYRYAPSRTPPKWPWVNLGAVVATLLWLAVSVGLSVYVSNFGDYNRTYGALAGVIVLLLWLWASAFVILLGAELNAELEAQTRKDSTVGPSKPMGQRGAVKADTLGRSFG